MPVRCGVFNGQDCRRVDCPVARQGSAAPSTVTPIAPSISRREKNRMVASFDFRCKSGLIQSRSRQPYSICSHAREAEDKKTGAFFFLARCPEKERFPPLAGSLS